MTYNETEQIKEQIERLEQENHHLKRYCAILKDDLQSFRNKYTYALEKINKLKEFLENEIEQLKKDFYDNSLKNKEGYINGCYHECCYILSVLKVLGIDYEK